MAHILAGISQQAGRRQPAKSCSEGFPLGFRVVGFRDYRALGIRV